jgi:hypothetical protein
MRLIVVVGAAAARYQAEHLADGIGGRAQTADRRQAGLAAQSPGGPLPIGPKNGQSGSAF